jgi:hypothetical protein
MVPLRRSLDAEERRKNQGAPALRTLSGLGEADSLLELKAASLTTGGQDYKASILSVKTFSDVFEMIIGFPLRDPGELGHIAGREGMLLQEGRNVAP